MNEHLQSFLNYLQFEKKYSAHTLTSYQNDLSQFQEFLKKQFEIDDTKAISHLHIKSWLASLMS
jgi:integrase/recombinase XerC